MLYHALLCYWGKKALVMPLLKLVLLGMFRCWRDGELVTAEAWPAQKPLEVFKVLLTRRGHVVATDQLMEFIWPDLPPSSAANCLRVAISQLRRVLQPGLRRGTASAFILTCDKGYLFRGGPGCWIDVDAFVELVGRGKDHEGRAQWGPAVAAYQAARELYQGDFFEENLYADWAIVTREYLREIHLDALGRLANCHARQGHYRRAQEVCQQAIALDPLRESLYRQAMIYHCKLGQRDQALRLFERCRNILVDELGVDPMPETLALYTKILRDEIVGEPPDVASAISPVPRRRAQLATWLPLVGRSAEMKTLAGVLGDALAGRGRLVFITGEAGVGKSRLADEFLALCEENGARVFRGRAYQLERDLSYQPVREALRRYLLNMLMPEEMRHVLGPWAPHVSLLLPELRQNLPDLPSLPALAIDKEQQRLLDGLVQFCLSLAAQRPVVFFLDDLHWADPSTLLFLHYLARHIAQKQVLLLMTYRPVEVASDHPVQVMQREFEREHLATPIELEPLPVAAVTQILAQNAADAWDSAPFSCRLYDETEGNPLFLVETLRSLFDAGLLVEDDAARWRPAAGVDLATEDLALPPSVQSLIKARCEAADVLGQRVLWAAAVIGRSSPFDLLQRVTGLETEKLLDGLDELIRHQLIAESIATAPSTYSFTHEKIRQVVYAGLNPSRRAHLHRATAQALEETHTGRAEQIAGLLAYHFAEAREESSAVGYWLLAGDRARTLYAHQEAAEHYQRALAFLKQRGMYERAARTLMKLGLTRQIASDYPLARQAYDEGFALWRLADKGHPHETRSSDAATLRIDWPGSIRTLDPHFAIESMSAGIVDQLFCGLVDHSPDLEVVPDLAESWQVDAEGRKYLFHLRGDARWSDGAPVTAGDFEHAWRRALDPTTRSPVATILHDIKGARAFQRGEVGPAELGVHARGPSALSVELETPNGYFLHLLAHHAALPLPRHVVEVWPQEWTAAEHFVTNGPFRLQSWEPGQSITLVRNPDYRGSWSGNVCRVEMRLDSDASSNLDLYKAGCLDILHLEYALSLLVERAWELHAGEYMSTPRLQTAFLAFNTTRPPFADVRVRQALVLGVDQTILVDAILRGFVTPATGGFIPPGMPGHSAGVGLPYDVGRARSLLAAAGYPGGRGFPLIVGMVQRGRHWELAVAYLQQQWREQLGIVTDWQLVEPGQLIDRLLSDPPAILGTGWYADYPDPDNFMRTCSIRRRMGWQNRAYENLVDRAARVTDQSERMRLYQQADQLLMTEAVIMPLSYGRLHRLVQPWIKRLPTSPMRWWFWKDVLIERD